MDVKELVAQAREAMTVTNVVAAPVERNGVTVIPVAKVRGGFGGGDGRDDSGGATGSGGGFGVLNSPAGAFVIKDDDVSWRPAVDVNRIVLGGQLVMIVALLVFRSIRRRRVAA